MKILNYITALLLIQAPLIPYTFGEENIPQLKYDLKEDGRNWKIGNKIQNDALTIVQYVPDEQQPAQLREVVTVMELNGVNSDLKDYYQSFLNQLAKNASGHKVSHRTINEEAEKNIFGEWWIEEQSPQDQHEWFKMFKDGNKLYIIRYTTSDKETIQKNRAKWEKIIGNAKFEDHAKSTAPAVEN